MSPILKVAESEVFGPVFGNEVEFLDNSKKVWSGSHKKGVCQISTSHVYYIKSSTWLRGKKKKHTRNRGNHSKWKPSVSTKRLNVKRLVDWLTVLYNFSKLVILLKFRVFSGNLATLWYHQFLNTNKTWPLKRIWWCTGRKRGVPASDISSKPTTTS